MKKQLSLLALACLNICVASAQTTLTGPSSSQSPYLIPTVANTTITSVLTVTDVIGGYKMCGIADGLGAFDNGNGTFTLLMNHEFGSSAGVARAHGQAGSFVSKWIINKSTLAVQSGSDLIQTTNLWTGTTYTAYTAATSNSLSAFGRFCSADLPEVSAFYNSTSMLGSQERIFMNGEEIGAEGRTFAHVVTGSSAGNSYQLPYLGRGSWENAVANPNSGNKTVVCLMDDATPGQVYFYIGNKTNSGTEIDKAGLTNGKLYGVAVTSLITESSSSVPVAGTTFSLIDLGNVSAITGASLNTMSNNMGVTNFLRPEDGAWNPSAPTEFYFATTNSFSSPSRLWKLNFTSSSNPELGGTVTAVLDGTEGQKMIDNLCVNTTGQIYLQEDPGFQTHNAKIWKYNIATDALTLVAEHDPVRFVTVGATLLTIDEESSGILDMSSILGAGSFIFVDQAHYSIPGEVVEGGQLLVMRTGTTTIGINETLAANQSIIVFPNPAKDEAIVKINVEQNQNVVLNVIDVTGKTVFVTEKEFNKGEQTIKINTSNFKSGNYFIKVTAGNTVNTVKLVVVH